ncbi:MAG TPA: tripartite tricarboxylate transporter TctB family protein [Burkholderiales bacterium]|nr:tripartite tricarboxylate transporter TctB family protein [Burkholderiales bacterium]
MSISIRSPRDFCAGLIFLFFGALAAYIARDYPMGSAVRMGPGYFPYLLGILLALLGVVICIKSLVAHGERIESASLRALLLVLGAIGVFAGTIESAGIVIATALLVGIGAAASPESRLREVVVLIVFMLALAVGLFTYGLGLPFRILPI